MGEGRAGDLGRTSNGGVESARSALQECNLAKIHLCGCDSGATDWHVNLPAERLASLHIHSTSEALMPDSHATACIVGFPQKHLLLTVSHATGDGQPWALTIRSVAGRGVEIYRLGSMNFLSRLVEKRKKFKPRNVDFSYVEVPKDVSPLDEEIDHDGKVIAAHPKVILPPEFSTPIEEEDYAFFGLTRHRLDDHFRLHAAAKHEVGMKFVGEEDDLYRFGCREKYFEYEEYKGCSGAPILDSRGRLVSILLEGSDDRKALYGLNLKHYWSALLIEIGAFG